MKKLFTWIFALFIAMATFTSCKEINKIKHKELFAITDNVVNSLYTTYESYGLLGGLERKQYTSDLEYKVFPVGRLVNVRIEHYATDAEYETLRKDLEDYYKGNYKVNRVYRCQGGTIMIDCRR